MGARARQEADAAFDAVAPLDGPFIAGWIAWGAYADALDLEQREYDKDTADRVRCEGRCELCLEIAVHGLAVQGGMAICDGCSTAIRV